MADHQSIVDAARRALAEQQHYQLGKLLAHWIDIEGATSEELARLADEIGSSRSSLYNAIGVYRLARRVGLSEEDVARIGYTKLTVVAPYLDEDVTRDSLIARCEGRTVAELKAAMVGIAGSVKIVVFALNKGQRKKLDAALIRHGAIRSVRGLQGKEEALMKLLSERA